MRFSIITPTYKRADLLLRAVRSVQAQTYQDWELIIVNDSPADESYRAFASSINDPRIQYHTNDMNRGVNFSRNFALDHASADSTWVLFLDDDDYLSPDALKTLHDLSMLHPAQTWFITNRAQKNGTAYTVAPKSDTTYSYAWEYLLLRRLRGDATHCILASNVHLIRFSKRIKQGEEWFFFYQLGLHEKIFYHDHNTTISDGYDQEQGLNFRKRTRGERFESISILLYEGVERGIAYHPTFLLYLFLRVLRLVV